VTQARQRVVNLYVVPGCPLCARARAWLNERGISYVESDVANNFGALRRMYKLTRQNLVPVFEVDGRVLVRPDDEALADLLL
jgi:glutaredoxin 3